MMKYYFKIWNRGLHFIAKHLVITSVCLCIILIGVAMTNLSRFSSNLIETQALQSASFEAQSISEAVEFYSELLQQAEEGGNLTVTHDYHAIEGAIPLPGTYAVELGTHISNKHPQRTVRLYSDFPFPWRQDEGLPQDDFEREALTYLRQHPAQTFSRVETVAGHPLFRYGEASIMLPRCVACHNSYPETPKQDWKEGDVRGVLEITLPLDQAIAQTRSQLQVNFLSLGGVSLVGIAILAQGMARFRRKSYPAGTPRD